MNQPLRNCYRVLEDFLAAVEATEDFLKVSNKDTQREYPQGAVCMLDEKPEEKSEQPSLSYLIN